MAGPRVAMLPPEPLTEVGVVAVAAAGAGVLPPDVDEEEDEEKKSKLKKAAEVIQETPQILLKKFSIYTRNKKYANAVSVLEKFGDKK